MVQGDAHFRKARPLGKASPAVDQARVDENMRQWRLAMEATHEMILAGIRLQIGPDGDLQAAYRQWYARQRDMSAERLDRAEAKYMARRAKEQDKNDS